jgi:hypothetical protein
MNQETQTVARFHIFFIITIVTRVAQTYPFERSLKGVSHIKLGEAQDQRLQLFEPKASFVIA